MHQNTSALAADPATRAQGYASPAREGRSVERLRAHFEVERDLANRLRQASHRRRKGLYAAVYDELYQRVPDHPQLTTKSDPEDRHRYVADQMRLLGRFLRPGLRMIEVGPGDCSLAIHACGLLRQVFAVDVSAEITRRTDLPVNFALCLSDGVSVPHPEGGVDVVYSNQLMEHLHPDDARAQLRNILAALVPGGVYVCITPNRHMGPHDISKFFSQQPQGLHLREYSATELLALFKAAGFRRTAIHVAIRNRYVRLPKVLVYLSEHLLGRCSWAWRHRLLRWPPFRWLATVSAVARK